MRLHSPMSIIPNHISTIILIILFAEQMRGIDTNNNNTNQKTYYNYIQQEYCNKIPWDWIESEKKKKKNKIV